MRFLAGSPLLAGAQQAPPGELTDPRDALNVLDFEAAARKALPPAHFAYLASGVDDDVAVRANREGYSKWAIRPRRLVDVSQVDMSVDLFGTRWETPIVLAPAGSQKAFHPQGELAVARAARTRRALKILSTVTTSRIEDVAKAIGGEFWYQLYATADWNITKTLVHRAESAGCPVITLTVDRPGPRNSETEIRGKRLDKRTCTACHTPGHFYDRKPMFAGTGMKEGRQQNPSMTWDFIAQLRGATRTKLVLKGIETREDAELAVKHGADGVIVSNHGGRGEDSGRGTVEALPEVVEAVGGRIPVLLDGGIRRGTDIYKALALGARAICIGRPYLWGLSAFGQPGVERVLEILTRELDLILRAAGTPTLASIRPESVTRR